MELPTKPRTIEMEGTHEGTPALHQGRAAGPAGGYHHDYLATIQPGPVMGEILLNNTGAPLVYNTGTTISPCWLCDNSDQPETLFTPCQCDGMVHRHCFRKWRQGWINPRNYFNCPRCMYSYNIEQIKDSEVETEQRIRRNFKIKLAKLLLTVALIYGLTVAFWAGATYGMDTSEKNIPVAVKYMMTSVVTGIPNSNTTELWESNFKKSDVSVWPYYTMFGVLLTSVLILLVFCAFGCTFEQKEYRKDRRCCQDCCSGGGGGGSGYNDPYCFMWAPIDCGNCNCNCCSSGPGDSCSGGSCGGGGGGGGGGCDVGEGIIVLVLIVVVAVILSAVFVVIFYTLQKSALLYDKMSHMIMSQSRELEGETIVLGKYESWRPLDSV